MISRCDRKLRLQAVTYALVGVVVAIDVEDGQDKDIHLVEQAGHLRITAVGGQSLRKIGKIICAVIGGSLCISACHAHPGAPLTSLTNHWQKAGEIHSLAWIPQSMKIAGLVELDFLPSCGC